MIAFLRVLVYDDGSEQLQYREGGGGWHDVERVGWSDSEYNIANHVLGCLCDECVLSGRTPSSDVKQT